MSIMVWNGSEIAGAMSLGSSVWQSKERHEEGKWRKKKNIKTSKLFRSITFRACPCRRISCCPDKSDNAWCLCQCVPNIKIQYIMIEDCALKDEIYFRVSCCVVKLCPSSLVNIMAMFCVNLVNGLPCDIFFFLLWV